MTADPFANSTQNTQFSSTAFQQTASQQTEVEGADRDSENHSSTQWQIKLLYDGQCPLCLREVNFLSNRDAGRGLVAFVDIADPRYSPEANGGIDFETAMGRIHAVLPDGTVIKNVEVFRRVYEILGIGWVYAATKLPVVGFLADWFYGIWANWRLKLTGRPDLSTLVAQRANLTHCSTAGSTKGSTASDSTVGRCR